MGQSLSEFIVFLIAVLSSLALDSFLILIYDVIFHDDDDEHDEHSSASAEFMLFGTAERGAQIRTVASSDADANIDG